MSKHKDPTIALELQETENFIKHIRNSDSFYDAQVIDFLVGMHTSNQQDMVYHSPLSHDFEEALVAFKTSAKKLFLKTLHIHGNHFVALAIHKTGEIITVNYIDPTGANSLSKELSEILIRILGIDDTKILISKTIFQATITGSDKESIASNNHCGAFVAYILEKMSKNLISLVGDTILNHFEEQENEEKSSKAKDLGVEESDKLGKKIREQHLSTLEEEKIKQLESKELQEEQDFFDSEADENTKRPPQLAEIEDQFSKVEISAKPKQYTLKRSDSNSSMYSDLLEEMIDYQIGAFDSEDIPYRADDYETFIMKQKPVDIEKLKKKLNKLKKPIREEIKEEKKASQTHINDKLKINSQNHNAYKKAYAASPEIKKLETQIKSSKKTSPIETPEKTENRNKRMHLFRGKCLNSKILKNGELHARTGEEKKNIILDDPKVNGVYADGITEEIRKDPKRLAKVKEKTVTFLGKIKKGNGEANTSLFNAGNAYDSAVRSLMKECKTTGNTVVATSKLPWVASEYIAGNLGGAAGGDRSVAYGYLESKKPYNRCLGNGYAASITLEEYQRRRATGEMVDVNLDIETGVKPNQAIEEVTFVCYLPPELMAGSLPMVLPRFDRKYEDMAPRKQAQYLKVFNLNEEKYKELQDGIGKRNEADKKVPIGKIVDHIIDHHGILLRQIAIKHDRDAGYEGSFVVTKNENYHSQYVGDVGSDGINFSNRDTRIKNRIEKADYRTGLEEELDNLSISK